MDILFVIILILLGSRIFSKKNRGNGNDDSGDVSHEEDQPQGLGCDKSNGERTGAAMTWEDMEKKYGIKIEHDKPTMAESSRREVEKKEPISIPAPSPVPDVSWPSETSSRPSETTRPSDTTRSSDAATPSDTLAAQPNQPTLADRLAQYKAARSVPAAALTPIADTLQVTSRRRKSRLPAGGLKAGIMWSLILEPPKAKQRRAGGSL